MGARDWPQRVSAIRPWCSKGSRQCCKDEALTGPVTF